MAQGFDLSSVEAGRWSLGIVTRNTAATIKAKVTATKEEFACETQNQLKKITRQQTSVPCHFEQSETRAKRTGEANRKVI